MEFYSKLQKKKKNRENMIQCILLALLVIHDDFTEFLRKNGEQISAIFKLQCDHFFHKE